MYYLWSRHAVFLSLIFERLWFHFPPRLGRCLWCLDGPEEQQDKSLPKNNFKCIKNNLAQPTCSRIRDAQIGYSGYIYVKKCFWGRNQPNAITSTKTAKQTAKILLTVSIYVIKASWLSCQAINNSSSGGNLSQPSSTVTSKQLVWR